MLFCLVCYIKFLLQNFEHLFLHCISDTLCCVDIHHFTVNVEWTVVGREGKRATTARKCSSPASKMATTNSQRQSGKTSQTRLVISSKTFWSESPANDCLLNKFCSIHGYSALLHRLPWPHPKYLQGTSITNTPNSL